MKKPKYTKKEHIKCAECKKAIHIDDLGMISNKGMYHKDCIFKISWMDSNNFLTGYETKIKTHVKPKTK